MSISPPIGPPAPLTYTVGDIITDAFIEIGAVAPGEQPSPEEAQWGFRKANYLLDEWAADEVYVYSRTFQVFTLVPNLSPHTIGPDAATFSWKQRPVRIESASILLPGAQTVDLRIATEDEQWWAENPVKGLATTFPTHLYYSPDNPNGSLYFWPVPTLSYQCRLQLWTLLSQFTGISDPVDGPGGFGTLPPAYRSALMLTLAESLRTGLGLAIDQSLAGRALKARMAIMGNNSPIPRISTDGDGMPTAQTRPRFNFLTREPW